MVNKFHCLLLLFLGCLWALACTCEKKGPQVISLKHPESNQYFKKFKWKKPKKGSAQSYNPYLQPYHTARPGNVVVHFDRDHEVSRLQYVLEDGSLATLYQRHQPHQVVLSPDAPIQVWAPGELQRRQSGSEQDTPLGTAQLWSPEEVQRRAELGGSTLLADPAGQLAKGVQVEEQVPDQTIEIKNSQNQGVSQLVGDDHVTLSLPPSSMGVPGSGNDRMAILATIAADTLKDSNNQHTASHLLERLKSKVGKKLRELPRMIETKLRAKSGRIYLNNKAPIRVQAPTAVQAPVVIQEKVPNQTQVLVQEPARNNK